MTNDELIENFPRLYHMANANSWESIRHNGLRSTTALLDLFNYSGESRALIESARRPTSVTISHAQHGTAVIRDNIPMREAALLKCLTDMSPRQWYETLNRRVFFWLSPARLDRLLKARAYREESHCVLELDTGRLVADYEAAISLSPINSGATLFTPQPRGTETFRSIEDYDFSSWAARRGTGEAVVELTVDYQVENIHNYLISASINRAGTILRHLHR